MTRLRVAMIGAGGFAARHLDVLAREADALVVAHAARRLEEAQAQASRYGGRAFDDVATLLDAERIDAAWVCVAPAGHGAIEQALIERGVPFFVDRAPRAAPADLDVASVSTAALRFASGALGTVTATCLLGASARVEL